MALPQTEYRLIPHHALLQIIYNKSLVIVFFAVNEVSVDEVVSQTILGITMKSVGCTYNFLPAFQPKWFTPEGVEIMDGKNYARLF